MCIARALWVGIFERDAFPAVGRILWVRESVVQLTSRCESIDGLSA